MIHVQGLAHWAHATQPSHESGLVLLPSHPPMQPIYFRPTHGTRNGWLRSPQLLSCGPSARCGPPSGILYMLPKKFSSPPCTVRDSCENIPSLDQLTLNLTLTLSHLHLPPLPTPPPQHGPAPHRRQPSLTRAGTAASPPPPVLAPASALAARTREEGRKKNIEIEHMKMLLVKY
jgi:hypothetical protein